MTEGAVTLLLRCELCNKPFDKQSTLKRHGYYCRSRKVGSTSRLRSCTACARGKVRCDTKRPECSRCLAKSITCHYPAPRASAGTTTPSSSLGAQPASVHTPAENITASNSAFQDIEHFNWEDADMNFADFLHSPLPGEEMDHLMPNSDACLVSPPSSNATIHVPQNLVSVLDWAIPPTPTNARRSLVPRSKPLAGQHRTITMILHMLKSYPQMMLRNNVLPPFIHPYLASPEFGSNDMEPLNNCISLVRMISQDVKGSKKLFWKNVRLECERFMTESTKSNNLWDLLAAMHALSIYVLLRLSEGETEYNNFDVLLLTTMTALARHLALSDISYKPTAHECDTKACWKEWIYMESRRRLSAVFRIINMLVYFDVGTTCALQSGLVLAPLPAKKELWEAPDEVAWKAERDKQPVPRTAFGLTTSGELVRLGEMDLYGGYGVIEPKEESRTSEQNWAEWCAGIDSFGGLILLAASLVG